LEQTILEDGKVGCSNRRTISSTEYKRFLFDEMRSNIGRVVSEQ
jgi:hypothetical protein